MLRNLLKPFLLVLVFCLALAGVAVAASPHHDRPVRSVDNELAAMGREIPGFGGLYYDKQGRANVYLLNPQDAGKATVKSLGTEVIVHRGEYEFERLLDWRLKLRPILASPGVIYLDVDETSNRIVIGMDFSSHSKSLDRGRLDQQILAAGVPREAVVLRETAHIAPLANLRSQLRPVPGGVQDVFLTFICTLGFNAFLGEDFGFVTAAHCTDVFGQVDGTQFFQPLPGDENFIATEIANPAFSTDPPCPAGRRCRFSDSAFAKYDDPSLGALGQIARPVFGDSAIGSIRLKPSSAAFTLTGSAASPLVGQTVHKVGRTTGWTFGTVINTCVDVNEDPDITLFCQTLVQIGGGPGDSGAPVFITLRRNRARLVGLLWGGGDDPQLGVVGVFSPLDNIEADLGPLQIN